MRKPVAVLIAAVVFGCRAASPTPSDDMHDAWPRTYNLSAHNDVYSWLLERTKQR